MASQLCNSCGAARRPGAKFCGNCGSQFDDRPELIHCIGGAVVGVLVGAVAWIMLLKILSEFGFSRYFGGVMTFVISAIALGVIVAALTMVFGGGRDTSTMIVAGGGGLVVVFVAHIMFGVSESAPLRFLFRLYGWPSLLSTLFAVAAAVGVTFLRPPFTPWRSSPS